MLRSKIKLFEKGDQLICVHDTQELETGDVVLVFDVCPTCLGLILEGHQVHYQDEHFDKYSQEKKFHFQRDPSMIEKQKVANIFTDLIKVMMMNSHRGVFHVEATIDCIKHNLIILGVDTEFRQPLNKPDDLEENKN